MRYEIKISRICLGAAIKLFSVVVSRKLNSKKARSISAPKIVYFVLKFLIASKLFCEIICSIWQASS